LTYLACVAAGRAIAYSPGRRPRRTVVTLLNPSVGPAVETQTSTCRGAFVGSVSVSSVRVSTTTAATCASSPWWNESTTS